MPAPERDYRRWILGGIAVACGITALVTYFVGGDEHAVLLASSTRLAFIFGVLWLALPDVMRGPAVFLYMLVAVVAVAAAFRGGRTSLKIIVPAMIVLGILSFLRRFTGATRRR